jgi:spore coat-associated protein N
MDRLSILLHSRRWLLLAALALVSLALGSAIFSGAGFTSKSANSASLATASIQLSTSAANQAIVAATGMKPGDSRQGTIAIGNKGAASGTVVLKMSGLSGSALATAIDFKLEDVTGGGTVQKWSGKLGSFASVDLGSFGAATTREYRFTLSWPAAADDASLQGASTSLTFQWHGTAKGAGA